VIHGFIRERLAQIYRAWPEYAEVFGSGRRHWTRKSRQTPKEGDALSIYKKVKHPHLFAQIYGNGERCSPAAAAAI
jgi:hypothetical protein